MQKGARNAKNAEKLPSKLWKALTSGILAGSRRHSTSYFSESVVMAETNYQMLEVLAFCYRQRD